MKTTAYIQMAFGNSKEFVTGLLADMKDAPLTQPTFNGGNHPLWILGHIVHSQSALLDCFILGQPNRFPDLENCCGGSTPTTSADDYPSMDEMFAEFETIRAASLSHLETLNDDDFDKKSHAPEEFSPVFGTVGACFAAMTFHPALYGGQVADAGRAAGREPLMKM